MKNIIYYNPASHQVKMAPHVVFDEAINNSDVNYPILNVFSLKMSSGNFMSDIDHHGVSLSPFLMFFSMHQHVS